MSKRIKRLNDRFGVDFRIAGIFRIPGKADMRLPGSLSGPAHGGSWVEREMSSFAGCIAL
jgi:hypothetical protein